PPVCPAVGAPPPVCPAVGAPPRPAVPSAPAASDCAPSPPELIPDAPDSPTSGGSTDDDFPGLASLPHAKLIATSVPQVRIGRVFIDWSGTVLNRKAPPGTQCSRGSSTRGARIEQ